MPDKIDALIATARYIIAEHPSKDTLTGTLETMGKLADALSAARAVIEEAKAALPEEYSTRAHRVARILSKFPSGEEEGK